MGGCVCVKLSRVDTSCSVVVVVGTVSCGNIWSLPLFLKGAENGDIRFGVHKQEGGVSWPEASNGALDF